MFPGRCYESYFRLLRRDVTQFCRTIHTTLLGYTDHIAKEKNIFKLSIYYPLISLSPSAPSLIAFCFDIKANNMGSFKLFLCCFCLEKN
jgi:hypothetical protein